MKSETVILLHGILRSKIDMLPLSKYLEKQGYQTLNILYPSRKKSLEDLTDFVHHKIQESNLTNSKINFVSHSMGGLISRYYIATYKPENLGSVVMLSPPNTGSEFADYLTENKMLAPIYKAAFGPAGQQLTTAYQHIDTTVTYPLGIIAGSRSINPFAPLALPRATVGDHDGIVPVARTHVDGMRDHIIMPVNHTTMMFNKGVMRQTHHFLLHQKFGEF